MNMSINIGMDELIGAFVAKPGTPAPAAAAAAAAVAATAADDDEGDGHTAESKAKGEEADLTTMVQETSPGGSIRMIYLDGAHEQGSSSSSSSSNNNGGDDDHDDNDNNNDDDDDLVEEEEEEVDPVLQQWQAKVTDVAAGRTIVSAMFQKYQEKERAAGKQTEEAEKLRHQLQEALRWVEGWRDGGMEDGLIAAIYVFSCRAVFTHLYTHTHTHKHTHTHTHTHTLISTHTHTRTPRRRRRSAVDEERARQREMVRQHDMEKDRIALQHQDHKDLLMKSMSEMQVSRAVCFVLWCEEERRQEKTREARQGKTHDSHRSLASSRCRTPPRRKRRRRRSDATAAATLPPPPPPPRPHGRPCRRSDRPLEPSAEPLASSTTTATAAAATTTATTTTAAAAVSVAS